MLFKNNKHATAYAELLSNVPAVDNDTIALMYLMGLIATTYSGDIEDLCNEFYNFDDMEFTDIDIDAFLCTLSECEKNILRFAFTLCNAFDIDDRARFENARLNLFDLFGEDNGAYMVQALMLKYPNAYSSMLAGDGKTDVTGE